MLSRRSFLRSSAAFGVLAAAGLREPAAVQPVSIWEPPPSIDNTGSQNVSLALTEWMATTGRDGDLFKLRRRPGNAPGEYWIPQGIAIRRWLTLDLNGCSLFTGPGDGSDYAPIYDDHGDVTWPERRYCIGVVASNVKIRSSLPNARIQGGAREANVNVLGIARGIPYIAPLEDQHGIRSHGRGNIYDLNNIAIEYVYADGIYVVQGSASTWIVGRNLGDPVKRNLGGILEGKTWRPEPTVYPGIHHTGRHGIATADCFGLVIDGVSIWHTGRAIIDLEAGGVKDLIDGVRILSTESGTHQLLWLAVAGRTIHNLVVADNICHEQLTISTGDATTPRHSNWRILRNRGGLVFDGNSWDCYHLTRVDGLEVRDNFQLVNGKRQSMGLDVGSSTNVVVAPSPDVQFPVA
jgi:hypothetical protein